MLKMLLVQLPLLQDAVNATQDFTQHLIALAVVHAKLFVPVVIQRLVHAQVASQLHTWLHLDVLPVELVVPVVMLTAAPNALTDTSWIPPRKLVLSAVLTVMPARAPLHAQLAKLHIT
jgi:hypothetical protein